MYRWARNPVVFYLLTPVAIAIVFAMFRSGLAALMPAPQGLLFWLVLMLPSWWAAHAVASVAHVVLRPWRPPLWLLCTIGGVGQALIFSPAYRVFHRWAEDQLVTSGHYDGHWPLPAFTLDYVAHLAWAIAPSLSLLVAVNYAFDRVLGVPRLRYDDAVPDARIPRDVTAAVAAAPATVSASAADAPAPAPLGQAGMEMAAEPASTPAPPAGRQPQHLPAILRQSRLPHAALVYAMSAEEHYVRLFSDAGTDMVRYRFSDALDEFAAVTAGMQVHRSWWVRPERARHWHLRGRMFELEFDQGLRVPISLAFREAVLMRAPAEVRAKARRTSRRGAGMVGNEERASEGI